MSPLRDTLNCAYQKRLSLNRSYSKNAFARDLGISATALSQFLSGKRNFSKTNLKRIASALCLPFEMVINSKDSDGTVQIQMDTFSLIAEWYHYAILNLVEVDVVQSAAQISKRLSLEEEIAEQAVERLIKLGFLKKSKTKYERLQPALDASSPVASEALRKHNREKMELAILALQNISVHERDISSVTLTFDPKKIAEVRNEIKKFKKRINSLCSRNQVKEVYSLNIQFFPLSKKENK